MPVFGQPSRPGGEPPPRQPLTPEQLHARETHMGKMNGAEVPPSARNEGGYRPVAPDPEAQRPQPNGFDENAARAILAQVGLDLQVFPIGEKPADPNGRGAYREKRLAELESERAIMIQRTKLAEGAAAKAVHDIADLQGRFDTLQGELESLRAARSQSEQKENG